MSGNVAAHAERLPLKIYSTTDGLPNNEINRIVRDSRGFLWFCTRDGLARFDGYTFTNYGREQGLLSAYVADLIETRDHEYWVATASGLVWFDPDGIAMRNAPGSGQPGVGTPGARPMFTTVLPEDGDPAARSVNVVREDREGAIWCGTSRGVYRLEWTNDRPGDESRAARRSPVLHAIDLGIPHQYPMQAFVSAIAEDRAGSLWFATASGLYRRWHDGRTARYTEREGLPAPYDTLHDVLVDHDGRLWVATRHGGLFQIATDASSGGLRVTRTFSTAQGLPTPWIFCLFETSDRRVWAGTNQGVVEILSDPGPSGTSFRTYSTDQGLSFREVTAVTEDTAGNLWLGTNTAGAMKLARNGLTTYGAPDGVGAIKAIFEDPTGSICVRGESLSPLAVPKETYGRFDGRQFAWFKPKAIGNLGWVGEQVTLQTRNGEWWLGTGEGVFRFAPAGSFAHIETERPLAKYVNPDGLGGLQVFRLFEDSRGGVWVATVLAPLGRPPSRRLVRWDRSSNAWTNVTDLVLTDDLPVSFGEDAAGRVWIGFTNRLVRYANATFTRFRAQEGLPAGAIANIHADRAGRLWLASSISGLIRVDDGGRERPTFVTYTTAQGLASNTTEVITEDWYGRIYVGTGRGLDRLDPRTGRFSHFTTADGLAPGTFRAAFSDHRGALWFGLSGGVSRLLPAPDPPASPPPVFVDRLVVAGVPRHVSAIGERALALPDLAPTQNQVQIDFLGLAFAPGEMLRYQYRLEGAAPEWSALSERQSVTFANLAPGRYRFLVRAVSADGTSSAEPAAVSFTILRPIWARWWFLSLAAALVLLAVRAAYRARLARVFDLANVRARIAADLHDDIGANLTKIAILSEVARQEQTPGVARLDRPAGVDTSGPDTPLSAIARISRESLAAMSDIVWAVNPHRDRLLDLVRRMRKHAEEIFTTSGIRLTFRAPADGEDVKLGPDVRRDVYLIFKEAVHNAVRHSHCSQVNIEIRCGSSSLTLKIADDGAGFEAQKPEEGHGLASMRHRAERLGGVCDVVTSPGRGTQVNVRIPTTLRRRLRRRWLRPLRARAREIPT